MEFEWDDPKAASNIRKHGVSFEEAQTMFEPANPLIMFDREHSRIERRYIAIGFSDKGRVLTVAFSHPQPQRLRIINARRATRREADIYAQAKAQSSQGES